LEQLTPATTRMRVVTNKGDFFFKDGATSTEIIIQTAQIVESDAATTAAKAPVAKAPAAKAPAAKTTTAKRE
jgi:hypothetical protein